MSSLTFSNRELRDAMREMSLSDSRVTIEERMSDTYEDMKETGTKAKQRLGQLSSGFMKKVSQFSILYHGQSFRPFVDNGL